MAPSEPSPEPAGDVHVWHAWLDSAAWPDAVALPAEERDRAARKLRARARRRWVASRWALRRVLGRYLGAEPVEIELRFGSRGKPALAAAGAALRFNLSHSGGLALIAVAREREVGVEVEWIGARPAEFYAEWTHREAVAKCHGTALGAPLPDAPVAVASIDAAPGFAASVAVAGDRVPALRRFRADPQLSSSRPFDHPPCAT